MDERTKIKFKNAAVLATKGTFLPICAAVFTALAPISGTVEFLKYRESKKSRNIHVSNTEDIVRALQIYGRALQMPTIAVKEEMEEEINASKRKLRQYDNKIAYEEKYREANTPDGLAKTGVQALLDIIKTAPSVQEERVPEVLYGPKRTFDDSFGSYYITIGDGIKIGQNAVLVDGKAVLRIPDEQIDTVKMCCRQRTEELLAQEKDKKTQDAIKLIKMRAEANGK